MSVESIFCCFIFGVCVLFCISCRSVPVTTNGTWDDGAAIGEYKQIIEQQRKQIAGLESAIKQWQTAVDRAVNDLSKLERGADDFESWINEVDRFVQTIIGVKLESDDAI